MSGTRRRARTHAVRSNEFTLPPRLPAKLENPFPPVDLFQPQDVERIVDAAYRILERGGVEFLSPAAQAVLRAGGCDVDAATGLVKFPRAVVQAALMASRRTNNTLSNFRWPSSLSNRSRSAKGPAPTPTTTKTMGSLLASASAELSAMRPLESPATMTSAMNISRGAPALSAAAATAMALRTTGTRLRVTPGAMRGTCAR